MYAVFHAEIGYARTGGIALLRHVVAEKGVDGVHAFEERGVVLQLVKTVQGKVVEQGYGVTLQLQPQFRIYRLEKVTGIACPRPPQVMRELVQRTQTLRQIALYEYSGP